MICHNGHKCSKKNEAAKKGENSEEWLFPKIGFPGGSAVKNLPAHARDMGLIRGLGRCPGEGNGNPLHYSCLRNPMGREVW